MEEHTIPDNDGKGVTSAFIQTETEYVNPIDYYSDLFMKPQISVNRRIFNLRTPGFPPEILERILYKNAVKDWNIKYTELVNTPIPENFARLLLGNSKKQQLKLMKGQSLTAEQLTALIFKAHLEYNYTFSFYSARNFNKGIDRTTLPKLMTYIKGKIKTVGKTSLSHGQLKQVFEQQNVIVARFIDRGEEWHCFFLTFKSLEGKENWKGGQAHLHYISDKFGVPRSEIVTRLKSGNYISTPVHISLLEYGNQIEKN